MSNDLSLLQAYVKNGDAKAFSQLVKRHAGLVFAAARRITGNDADAADVSQESFFELAKSAATIQPPLPLWLHTVTTRRALNLVRNLARRKARETSLPQAPQSDGPTWNEVEAHVDEAISGLPDELRQPLVLHYLQGVAQSEIAQRLGVHQSSVSRRLENGVEHIRQHLHRAGLSVPVALLLPWLEQCGPRALPAPLCAALGKLALSGVRGSAGAAAVSLPAAKLIFIVTAGISLVAGGWVAARYFAAEHSVKNTPAPISVAAPVTGIPPPAPTAPPEKKEPAMAKTLSFADFSPKAKQVMTNSNAEAARLGHDYIGTEHVLQGLAALEGSVASETLVALGASAEKVHASILKVLKAQAPSTLQQRAFTDRTKHLLERTIAWAQRLNAESVEPEHMLLGMLEDKASMAMQLLQNLGITAEQVKAKLAGKMRLTPQQLRGTGNEEF